MRIWYVILPLTLPSPASAQPFDLLQLYDQMLQNNPRLQGGAFEVDRATAQQDSAFSHLLPQLQASGNLSWNRLNQTVVTSFDGDTAVNQFEYQGSRALLQASQALLDLPAYYQLKSRQYLLRQADEGLAVTRMSLTSDLVEQYVTVLQAIDETATIYAEQVQTAADVSRLKKMASMQLVMPQDLYEVEAFRRHLETRLLEIDSHRHIALGQLQALTGVEVDNLAGLAQTTMPPVPDDADHWVAIGREQHPLLKGLQYAVDAAENSLKAAHAQHYPQVRLQVSQVYADSGGFDNRQSEPYDIGTVGLQMTLPLYAGGGIEAGVREAIANKGIAETERLTRIREVEQQIRAVFLQANAERARIDSLGQEVEVRRKAQDAQQRSYEIGVSTIVDALEARKNLLKSEADQAAARYSYIRLLVALRLWTGTLSRQDLEGINGLLH